MAVQKLGATGASNRSGEITIMSDVSRISLTCLLTCSWTFLLTFFFLTVTDTARDAIRKTRLSGRHNAEQHGTLPTSHSSINSSFCYVVSRCSNFKSNVVALKSNFLEPYGHGTPSSYVKDSAVVDIVSNLSQEQYQATVFYISEEQDYVILKTKEKVMYRDAPIELCDVMKKFVVCGYAKGFLKATYVHGTVYSTVPFAYECNSRHFGPFIYGTAKTSTGDSGAACFGKSGLMAINIGITIMPKKYHDEAIS